MRFGRDNKTEAMDIGQIEEMNKRKTVWNTFLQFCENIGERLLEGKKKDAFSVAYTEKSRYAKSVRKMWQEFRRQIISGTATAVVVIVLCCVVNLLDWSLGYEVIVDGENIGLVIEREAVFDAIDEVRGEVKQHLGEDKTYEKEPVFVRRIVAEDKVASKDEIKAVLLSNVDTMVEGYAVYVDGKAVLGLSSEEAAEWVLARYKQTFAGEEITEGMSVDFCEPVAVKKEFLHIALLETPEEALETLADSVFEPAEYVVQKDDTLWKIADRYGISVERILALNSSASENIKEGMTLRVEKPVPRLSVCTVQTVSLIEPVPYDTKEVDDGTIFEGRTVVAQEGKEGSANVLARITKVNGEETQKDILESETIAEPVTKIVKVGTKERPPTTGSGVFARPTLGTLSSRYGARWGRNHSGIDIAGAYNSDITAADGGKVIYADWMSGYGNYVVIDHENGYQTAYGHCASLCVKVGDRVAKGELVAKMGNTGRSTGTHLHFEVRKDGRYVDPLEYVGY